MSGGGENDAGDNNIRIDVTRDNIVNEVVEDHRGEIVVAGGNDGKNDGGGKFKTIRSFREDLRGLLKPPGTLWDQSYVGEVVTDGCHPANSSFAIGASGDLLIYNLNTISSLKFKYYCSKNVCVLFGVGGLVTGLATGFFSSSRVPLPVRTPIPGSLFPRFQTTVRNSIISSSVIWRMSKRAALGAILFAVLECDFQDVSLIEEGCLRVL